MNLKRKYYSLSEPQKMIYWGEMMFPDTSQNTMCATYELEEQNDLEVMKSAIVRVIHENTGLHIRIHQLEGVPYQYKHSSAEQVRISDFRLESDSCSEEKWINEKATHKFELFDSRLYNFYLFYRHDSSLNLLIQTHHIISDAWTHLNLATQIKSKYEQLVDNCTEIFNSRYSYLDYIKTEREYLESERCLKAKEFWSDKFKGLETLPNTFQSNRGVKCPDAERYTLQLSDSLQSKILEICSLNKLDYPVFFLSCLIITLQRISGGYEHLLGTLSYNRLGVSEKQGVGMFVNTLPLYIDIKDNRNFKEIVFNVNKELRGLLKHQRYPLSSITNDENLKKLNIAENIEIIYSYKNNMMPYRYTYQFNKSSIYPIVFRPSICESTGEFYIDIDYQTSLFNEEDIKKFGYTYIDVIDRLDLDVEKKVDFETVEIKNKISFVKKEHNLQHTLHGIFEDSVEKYSDKIAITYGDLSLTYRDLNNRSNYLANILVSRGCGKESPVALLLDRSIDMVLSILAVLKSGSCYIPISPEQPIKRIKNLVKTSGSKLLISNSLSCSLFSDQVQCIDLNDIDYNNEEIPNLGINIDSSQLAYIMYTSGSTGNPKGVMLEHKSVVNRLYWMQDYLDINSEDKLVQKSPYSFDVSVWEMFAWFFNGASMHLLQHGNDKDPEALISEIEKNKVTIIHFTPSNLIVFLDYLERGGSREKVKTLNHVVCSGEVLNAISVQRFNRLLGNVYNIEIHNLYGPTEAAIDVTSYQCTGDEEDYIPIGLPIDNTEVYILDVNGEVLPSGVSGEIYIGGVCLARGYLNNPELTNSKFIYHKHLDKRLYRTGDIGFYLYDGNIKFLGRTDDQVKVRGNRVEPGEIENCLLKYDGITESIVVAPVDNNGNTYLGAYFIANYNIPHESIRHYIQKELPSYMIPSFFVQMEAFPLTSNGKVDRKALCEPENMASKGKLYLAPINDREEEICEIWEDVLKVEKISRQDNFFDLGGDSLSLIKVHFALQEKFDVDLQSLFEYQTIESLSSHLHERRHKSIDFDEKSYRIMEIQRNEAEKVRNYYRSISSLPEMKPVNFNEVFITGSTGFLGVYIVREYLICTESKLHLLVRGENEKEASNRLVNKLKYYFGDTLYKKYENRINIVLGDLSEPDLGVDKALYKELSGTIDCIIHCAANVRHYGDRDDFTSTNVTGTEEIIKFCKNINKKEIIYISTMSVGLNSASSEYSFNFIENDSFDVDSIGNVYIDSKIMAENLILESLKELNGKIIRVGNIVHDSESGQFQENRDENGFISLLTEYKKKGCAPRIDIPFIDLSYVNETAKAVRLMSDSDLNGTFHVFNPDTMSLSNFCDGLNIKTVPVGDFIGSLAYGHPLLTHGYYLERINLLNVVPHSEMTNAYLNSLGFKWSSIDFEYIENNLAI